VDDVGERIALGFAQAERQRRANIPGAEVMEIDGLLLAFANVSAPPVNSVLVISEPSDPPAALAAAGSAFRERDRVLGMDVAAGRHASVDRAIRAAGLSLLFSWPAMAVDVDDLPERSLPEGVRVEPVSDARGAAAIARVEIALLDPAEIEEGSEVAERFYAAGSYGVEGARAFVAWEGDEPVGIASAHLREGAVGIFGVGVIPGARGRGIASALSVIAARAFPADLAWLHATDMARTVYERLGFREVAEWEVWVRSD
jgi:GNAT superfamily N-acetyltransferase